MVSHDAFLLVSCCNVYKLFHPFLFRFGEQNWDYQILCCIRSIHHLNLRELFHSNSVLQQVFRSLLATWSYISDIHYL